MELRPSTRVKGVCLPILVCTSIVQPFLSLISVPLLLKLGDIQALRWGQVVFQRQLALIIKESSSGPSLSLSDLAIKIRVSVGVTDRAKIRKGLAHVRAGINRPRSDSVCCHVRPVESELPLLRSRQPPDDWDGDES
ncbi:hypothetical protein BDV10DRAFT_160563 [Aspergillus recurvatus]